jgi:hypothetical protein
MKIGDLFRRDIHRRIEEVVKVDDRDVIAGELDEYVATDHIVDEMEKVLDAYQETINSPHEGCTVWVSGFFGSGKSSWAKVTGYIIANPDLGGITAWPDSLPAPTLLGYRPCSQPSTPKRPPQRFCSTWPPAPTSWLEKGTASCHRSTGPCSNALDTQATSCSPN